MLVGEIAEAVGELAVHAALVLMRVPSAHVGKCGFDAEVGLEQLRNLLHVVAELGVGIFCTPAAGVYCAGLAARSIFTASKVSSPAAWKMRSPVSAYMASKALAAGEGAGRAPPTVKPFTLLRAMAGILPARVRGTSAPRASARKAVCCLASAGATLRPIFGLQGAVEPAVLGALHAGRAGFHVVLRVKVRAAHVGRAARREQWPDVPDRRAA